MIYIVGAGGYPIDLMSVAALKLIKKADCILYDHLIDRHVLSFARNDCECIDVGKKGHGKTTAQSSINALLVEKGRQYGIVVRLKGGDPGIFGRGGEEMKVILDHGLDAQWIPGISAINALGYAGIPLTHRDISSGFSVDTLHFKDGLDHIDYKRIVRDTRTQVFFMGSDKIDRLVQGCLQAGINPKTSITFASRLTYPDQYVVSTTFDQLDALDRESLVSPILIVIGSCGKLHDVLDPQKMMRTYGKRVLFLSLEPSAWPIDDLWLHHGIFAYQIQVGEIKAMVQPLVDMDQFSSMVFVSSHAVAYFFDVLKAQGKDIRSFNGHTIIAIGDKTKACLNDHGLIVDRVFTHKAAIRNSGIDHTNPWLWIGSDRTRVVDDRDHLYACYQLQPLAFVLDGTYDAIGVSCPFAIERLALAAEQRNIPLYCFDHRSCQSAVDHGFTNIIPCTGGKQGLVDTMINDLEAHS